MWLFRKRSKNEPDELEVLLSKAESCIQKIDKLILKKKGIGPLKTHAYSKEELEHNPDLKYLEKSIWEIFSLTNERIKQKEFNRHGSYKDRFTKIYSDYMRIHNLIGSRPLTKFESFKAVIEMLFGEHEDQDW